MPENIQLRDGRSEFDLYGDPNRRIRLNLKDNQIFVRAQEAEEEMRKIIEEHEKLSGENMSLHDEIDLIKKRDDEIKRLINYVFDFDVSTPAFGNVSPMAEIDENGTLFFEELLDKLMALLKKHMEASQSRIQKHAGKYTS